LHRRLENQTVINDWFLWGFLKEEHIVSWDKFLQWKQNKAADNKKQMEKLKHQHPSHKTAQGLMQ